MAPSPTGLTDSSRSTGKRSMSIGSSPSGTLVGYDEAVEKTQPVVNHHSTQTVALTQRKKWGLLAVFTLAQYLDICGRSSYLVFVGDIARDLDISYESSTWILNSYGVTFGSSLLLWGRVSDLYSARAVFTIGFIFCGISNLIISFMTNAYAFYVFRGLYGVAAAATIPTAFRLILGVFEPGEVQKALALFGLGGALANATGVLWGGLFGAITATGQMSSWRWFCRFVCCLSIPFAVLSHFMCPTTRGPYHDRPRKWQYLDLVGCTLVLGSLLLLNVGLVSGASDGWISPQFLSPFIIAWPLAIAFIMWELRLPDDRALLPSSLWKIKNMPLMAFASLYLFSGIVGAQLMLVERWMEVFNETAIKAAVRILPQGLAMCVVVIIAAPTIKKITNMRYLVAVGTLVTGTMYIVMIYGDGLIGSHYWKYYFWTMIVSAIGSAVAFIGTNITMMTSVPPTMAGVAGALFQTCLQTGVLVEFSVQAGLLTIHEGSISNWSNVSASFWFIFGWGALVCLVVLVLYKTPKRPGQVADNGLGDAEHGSRDHVELKERSQG